jgi:hypothetical protein
MVDRRAAWVPGRRARTEWYLVKVAPRDNEIARRLHGVVEHLVASVEHDRECAIVAGALDCVLADHVNHLQVTLDDRQMVLEEL